MADTTNLSSQTAIRPTDSSDEAEAVDALDKYANDFSNAHPGMALNERGIGIHEKLRSRLAEQPAEPMPIAPKQEQPPAIQQPSPNAKLSSPITQPKTTPPPEVESAPSPEPGARRKKLTIGGGVTIGLSAGMLGMFIGTYVQAKSLENSFEAMGCSKQMPDETCQDLISRGERAQALAVTGIIAAPLLLGAGIAMLVVARRPSARQSIAPSLSPVMAGAVWQLRF